MKAMILAAGLGTRLLPFTTNTPKPLFPVAGRPLIDIIICSLQNAGCEAIIINTHHLYKKINSFLASQKYSIPVFTRYEPFILGTGGAIKNVADFWDDRPFMVINSDILTDIDLLEVYNFHLSHKYTATLVFYDYQPSRGAKSWSAPLKSAKDRNSNGEPNVWSVAIFCLYPPYI